MLSQAGEGARPIANQGPGAMIAVDPVARATAGDERDVPSAAIEILPKDGGSLGTWLVSDALGAPQTFTCGGRTWMITMRPARYYKPYSVTLQKFTHEKYAGTEIPKDFSSKVTLTDPDRSVNRDVLIYMNHPLRYRGETFYQAGFQKDDSATILQVVHNPSFIAPYVACVIVAAGLLVQFGFHLVGFSETTESNRMKRFLPWIIFVVAAACIVPNWLPPRTAHDDFDFGKFGEIPVLVGGRMKPLDTVARNSLLIIHGKQELRLESGKRLSAMQWLTDVLFNAPVADQYPVFVVQNADVLGLFGWQQSDRKYFSMAEFSPFLKQIDEQAAQSDKLEAVQRSAYQSAILNLRNGLSLYQRLKTASNLRTRKISLRNFSVSRAAFPARLRRRGNARWAKISTKRNSMMSPR